MAAPWMAGPATTIRTSPSRPSRNDGRRSSGMTATQQLRFWLIGLLVALIAVYLLRAILLPFVAGMAIAYFLDPACDRLEKWMSRTWATTVVTLVFAILIILALILIAPLLIDQMTQFAQ